MRKALSSPMAYVWLVAVAVILLKCLFIFLMPVRGLANTTWLIDDSFIEMKVAMNLAQGFGFSLDGIHPTTGAPFLWIYLSAIPNLFVGTDMGIRLILLESTIFGALATVLVFAIANKLTADRRIAWTAFLLATFTANAFTVAMNGMDTAFFTLMVIAAIATYLGVGKPKSWSPFAWGCITGLCAGLAIMTRGDGLFLILSLGCVSVYQWWFADKKGKRDHLQMLLGIVFLWAICFGIFMGWQMSQTGSPFPGNQVGRRELALAMHHFSFDQFSLAHYVSIVAWNVFQLWDLITIATGGALLALVALVSGTCTKQLKLFSLITWVYLGVFFALLVGYQWYFADYHGLRYLNPAAHLLFIFIAILLWQLPLDYWKRTAVAFLTLTIIVLAGYKHYQMNSRAPEYKSYIGMPSEENSKTYWAILDWMRDNLPEGTIVGVRDYGRVSMFTNVRIQDLAGNIDPEAVHSLNNGTLKEFLKERKVEYLFIPTLEQRQDKLYQYLHKEMHLELVEGAPPGPLQQLYKIIW